VISEIVRWKVFSDTLQRVILAFDVRSIRVTLDHWTVLIRRRCRPAVGNYSQHQHVLQAHSSEMSTAIISHKSYNENGRSYLPIMAFTSTEISASDVTSLWLAMQVRSWTFSNMVDSPKRLAASFQTWLHAINKILSPQQNFYFDTKRFFCKRVFCLSVVCNARAPYSDGWNFRQYFYGIWYFGHPLTSTENFTEIVPGEPLCQGLWTQEG